MKNLFVEFQTLYLLKMNAYGSSKSSKSSELDMMDVNSLNS